MGVGGGEAGAAVAVGEEGKEEEEDGGKGWRAKSKLSAAVAMVGVALAAGVERGAGAAPQPPPQRAGQGRGGHRVHVRGARPHAAGPVRRLRQPRRHLPLREAAARARPGPSLPPSHHCLPSTTDSFTSRHCFLGSTAASSWAPCSGSDARSLARSAPGVTRLLAGSCLLPLPVPSITMIP